jgi:uncharacterized metal-binding protein YceD (DUF177 family)
MTDKPKYEFSHEVDLAKVSKDGRDYRLEADASACKRIAERLRVPSVEALSGEIHIAATRKAIFTRGSVQGRLTRECVVSLEEMPETVDDSFEVEFVRRADDAPVEEDSAENWHEPEGHRGTVFDIGELLVQQFSLALDPFPRKPGAVSLAQTYGEEKLSSPFSILQEKIDKTEEKQ